MAHQLVSSIRREIADTRSTLDRLAGDEEVLNAAGAAAERCIGTIRAGGKVMFAGNGGSAADAQHFAAEFVSRFNFDRPGIAGLALTTDTSVLTAIGNDYGYEKLFSRQIEALGRPGDVFFALTTSGRSPNILLAVEAARARGVVTVVMTGSRARGTPLLAACDHGIVVPAAATPRVQEMHIVLGHIVCALVEEAIFQSRAEVA